tara:strand:- start:81 stop:1007 length:927 start_codon:yes stop_codon:yes gene_type:complete
MKTRQLNVYDTNITQCVNNEYLTPPESFRQPCLQLIVGQRTSGKSYLTSRILAQAKKDKTFDVIYCITPSFNSNKAYFEKYIKSENVFDPTSDSIQKVISRVEKDRDDWETFLEEKNKYKEFQKQLNDSNNFLDDNILLNAYSLGWMEGQKPKWKYDKEEPPKSMLIMDDVLSSPAISQSSGLTKIATLNRHVAPLETNHGERSACGLAVCILTQSYRMIGGISRVLRENISLLTLFKNKQQKQMDAIKEELANVVDVSLFDKAYNFATEAKHGNLTIDFKPKCNTFTFRKNLNEVILFDELKCECPK